MAGLSMLRVVSNDELVRQERELAERAAQERQNDPLLTGLAGYLRECWDAALAAKLPIERRMLDSLRQRNGEYSPSKLAAIRQQGGSEIYMMITEVKCRAAESWLRDILLDSGAPPWELKPTPVPDLSPEDRAEIDDAFAHKIIEMIEQTGAGPTPEEMRELREVVSQQYRFTLLQQAQMRADRMTDKIEDQLAEGGWADAFNEFVSDLATFPSAFLKGPVVRRQRVLTWVQEGGRFTVEPDEKLAPEFERVDPFHIYPEPGVTHIDDGYLFEHHPLTRMELADLIGVPGYDEDAIRMVLRYGGGLTWFTQAEKAEREQLQGKHATSMRPTHIFDALEFWGKVSGQMLIDWGLDEEDIPDPEKEYDANVWLVGNYVIRASLNYDPLGHKPYCKTSYIRVPGAFWGRTIPETISDVQDVCNAAARALVNNMGIASGPQVEINLERIPTNEPITQMFPWKMWQVLNDPMGSSAPAVRFNQPDDNAPSLMGVFDRFSRMADEHSGIPAYIYGDIDVRGAGRTSSGLSMLMGAAGKAIRQVVSHVDNDVIKPIIFRQFIYNMRYDEDESIKGDVEVIPRGSINLATQETLNVRRVEFLNATANPMDAEIIGKQGRAAILREVAKGLQMPTDDIVPSKEQLSQDARMQASLLSMPGGSPAQGQATELDGSPMGGQAGNVMGNVANAGAAQ